MATGETSFTSKGLNVKKSSLAPLPNGEYELRLIGSSLEVGKNADPGKMPYVRAQFEIVGHNFASGKVRTQTVWFGTGMKPGKDGIRNPERASGIVGFAKSAGVDFDIGFVEMDDGSGATETCLNPQQLKEYLSGLDGTVVKARLKVDKGNAQYAPGNKVDEFIPTESAVTFG
jgi:hypothetical protein